MFNIDNTILLVVDVQGRLATIVKNSSDIMHNIEILIEAAKLFEIPIIYTEQAPSKIGTTIDSLKHQLRNYKCIEKETFSCMRTPEFEEQLQKYNRQEIIVCGLETHVCVYQTVCDLIKAKYQVQTVQNAVSSRHILDHHAALNLMEQTGAKLTSTEMIICELIKTAQCPNFKKLMQLLR